jgi:hypothetical protein
MKKSASGLSSVQMFESNSHAINYASNGYGKSVLDPNFFISQNKQSVEEKSLFLKTSTH